MDKIGSCCWDIRLNRTRLVVSVPFVNDDEVLFLFIILSFIIIYGCRYDVNKWWCPPGIAGSETSDEPQNPSSELTGVFEELFVDDETIETVYSGSVWIVGCRFGEHNSFDKFDDDGIVRRLYEWNVDESVLRDSGCFEVDNTQDE